MVSGETHARLLLCARLSYLLLYFINSQANQTAELDNPYVLLYDRKISNVRERLPLHESIARAGRPLLVVAEAPKDDEHKQPMRDMGDMGGMGM